MVVAGMVNFDAGLVGRILVAGMLNFEAGTFGLLFSGAPTGISQRCPASPWRGFRAVLFNAVTDVFGLAVVTGV